ncbi:MAG: VWA domain-containing protein, partial [Actinomycetia bacterium]|nr:VWA domain-containing protein [Actinomycetes bacterium]
MMKRSLAMVTIVFLAVFLFATATNAATPESGSSSLRVTKTDISQFPQVKMYLSLATEKQAKGFKVWENGRKITNIKVNSKLSKQPVDVTLLIDVSGSMKGKPLDDAKAAAKVFIERARPDDRIAIVTFNSVVTRVADFTHDKGELAQAIDGLSAEGETAVYDGLFESINAAQDQKDRHQNLILLSDGADTASKRSGESAVELAGKSNIPVSVITLQS